MKKRDALDRFFDKVEFAECGCWLWKAWLSSDGYGQFKLEGRMRGAHCAAYEILVGQIPEGLQLDHLCRTRHCVNPGHLEAVTSQVNTLRGNAISVRNAAKTHCTQGHEFTPENTLMYRGKRGCRECDRASSRRYAHRKRRLMGAQP